MEEIGWVQGWSEAELLTLDDKNGDGTIQYTPDAETNKMIVGVGPAPGHLIVDRP